VNVLHVAFAPRVNVYLLASQAPAKLVGTDHAYPHVAAVRNAAIMHALVYATLITVRNVLTVNAQQHAIHSPVRPVSKGYALVAVIIVRLVKMAHALTTAQSLAKPARMVLASVHVDHVSRAGLLVALINAPLANNARMAHAFLCALAVVLV
jgi:hypothetical protein